MTSCNMLKACQLAFVKAKVVIGRVSWRKGRSGNATQAGLKLLLATAEVVVPCYKSVQMCDYPRSGLQTKSMVNTHLVNACICSHAQILCLIAFLAVVMQLGI